MPPDSVENNIGLLDVQFGALELSEVNDLIHLSPPITRHSPSPVSSDKLLHQSVCFTLHNHNFVFNISKLQIIFYIIAYIKFYINIFYYIAILRVLQVIPFC